MIEILSALVDSFRYKCNNTESYTLARQYADMADDLDRIVEFMKEEKTNDN